MGDTIKNSINNNSRAIKSLNGELNKNGYELLTKELKEKNEKLKIYRGCFLSKRARVKMSWRRK